MLAKRIWNYYGGDEEWIKSSQENGIIFKIEFELVVYNG